MSMCMPVLNWLVLTVSATDGDAGLLVRPRRCSKNSCIKANMPETSAAAMLVPDS